MEVSREMKARIAHVIATNLGNDPHQDRVNSQLAPPLDAASVYCHPDLAQASLNAVAAAASSCATARRLGWCLCRRERRAKLDAVVASASASMHLMLHIAAISTAVTA